MIRIRRILVPFDFSEHSERALRYAEELGRTFGAEVTVLHVVEDPTLIYASHESFLLPAADLIAQQKERAEQRLEELVEPLRKAGLAVQTAIEIGTPAMETCRFAKELEADLIIIGTHGRTGFRHFVMGSVAERIVRGAPCPVLSVRVPEHEFITDDSSADAPGTGES